MTFREYWQTQSAEQKRTLARTVGSTCNYLSQIAGGSRGVGRLAMPLHRATGIPLHVLLEPPKG